MNNECKRIASELDWKKANEEEAACLEVTSKVVELKSGIAEYTIYANNIKVKKGSQQYAAILIEKNEIDTFITELKAIKRHIEKENRGGEMW